MSSEGNWDIEFDAMLVGVTSTALLGAINDILPAGGLLGSPLQ